MSSKAKLASKVIVIEEAQDLKNLKLDDLVGWLLTDEIHVQQE